MCIWLLKRGRLRYQRINVVSYLLLFVTLFVTAYRGFVAEGKNQPSPWAKLKNQIYLGSDTYIEKMQRKIETAQNLSEVPAGQRRKPAKPLEYYAKKHPDRDKAIAQAYASGAYGMKEIGDHFGLHYSRVSRILAEVRLAKGKTP